jgi:hypothetical protein
LATWAPDGQHFFIGDGDRLQVFDTAGSLVKTFSGSEPLWLNSTTVEAYDPNQYPPADSDSGGSGQFYSVPGQAVDVTNRTVQQVSLPCCYPISNGHGAVAVSRWLPHSGSVRPTFVVWQGGDPSTELEGYPLGWDASGDKLAVLHSPQLVPVGPHFQPTGWLEVLSWPDLTSLYANRNVESNQEADFDPTGNYVAGSLGSQDASGIWRLHVDIIDLATGSLASVPVTGDSTKYGEGFVWNDQSQIQTYTGADPVVSTYRPDGTKVGQQRLAAPSFFEASANGTTLVSFRFDGSDELADLTAYRNGSSAALEAPAATFGDIDIAPDGLHILVMLGSPASGAYLAAVPL